MRPDSRRSQWLETTFRRIGLGFHLRDPEVIAAVTGRPVPPAQLEAMRSEAARYMDAEYYILAARRMGIQALLHHSKSQNGVCCYNTKVGHRFSLMGDRDFFREIVAACRKAGIVPVGYHSLACDIFGLIRHPDWGQMNAAGQSSTHRRVCPNNPGWRERALRQAAEIAGYDIGGIFFDELSLEGFEGCPGLTCYCPHCRAKFRAEAGADLPEKADWESPLWRRFVRFRYDTLAEFAAAAVAAVKRVNPDILCSCAFYGLPKVAWPLGWDAERMADVFDFIECDVAGVEEISCRARWYRALSKRRAVCMTGGCFNAGSYRDEGLFLPPVMFLASVMTTLAHGLTPEFESYGWHLPSLWSKKRRSMCSPEVDTIYLAAARAIRRREPWLTGAQPIPYAALYHSQASKDFYGRDACERYVECFQGWFETLVNGQVLLDMVSDRHLRADRLQPYRVLILPNAACLSARQADVIRAYVRDGGGLVATYATSLFDEQGRRQPDFQLSDVLGASYTGGLEQDYVIRHTPPAGFHSLTMSVSEPHPFFRGWLEPGETIKCMAPGLWTETVSSASTLARLAPDRGGADPLFAVHVGSDEPAARPRPAVVLHRYGRGRVVYLPVKLGGACHVYGHPYFHRLLVRAVRWAGGRSPIEVQAPACVEVTAFRQESQRRFVVHLLNYQGRPFRGVPHPPPRKTAYLLTDHLLPVHDLRVRLALPRGRIVRRVYWAPDRTRLAWAKAGAHAITVRVPRLDIHGMVVVECA